MLKIQLKYLFAAFLLALGICCTNQQVEVEEVTTPDNEPKYYNKPY